jgi:peptidoglycan hydrolase-like protein with peptidoglycan-binding domain
MKLRSPAHLSLALVMVAALNVPCAFAREHAGKPAPSKSQKRSPARRSSLRSVSAKGDDAAAPKPKAHARSKTRGSATNSRAKSRRQKGQMLPTADRISAIQAALAKNGSYTGELSGKWDDSTVEAMRRFQEAHGLSPTGKLDAKTLQQLGLGSSTAGLAPPMPGASSTTSPHATQSASRQ